MNYLLFNQGHSEELFIGGKIWLPGETSKDLNIVLSLSEALVEYHVPHRASEVSFKETELCESLFTAKKVVKIPVLKDTFDTSHV